MTKTYAITEGQLGKLWTKNTQENIDIVASLPLITGEPVAYMFKTNEGTEIGGLAPLPSKRDLLEIDRQGAEVIPLYTHPKPLQPITADDVTDQMVSDYFASTPFEKLQLSPGELHQAKQDISAGYNAFFKHRSEAR